MSAPEGQARIDFKIQEEFKIQEYMAWKGSVVQAEGLRAVRSYRLMDERILP